MYLYTPEQHAQIVDALHIDATEARLDEALAMLKAMQPVEPFQNFDAWNKHREPLQIILYTPTKD